MKRYPTLDPAAMTAEQRRVYDTIASGRRGAAAHGPFLPWLQSPAFADRAQAVGEYIRFDTMLPGRLKELVVLMVARLWNAQYEWYAHKAFAQKDGLADSVIDAIEARQRPDFTDADEAAVWDFADELLRTHQVSDARYDTAVKRLGADGVTELVGVLGYTLVSMTLKVFEAPLPEGVAPPLKD